MASQSSNIRKDKEVAEISGKRPGKAFNTVGCENIVKALNINKGIDYELLQFKNLCGQLSTSRQKWKSLIIKRD